MVASVVKSTLFMFGNLTPISGHLRFYVSNGGLSSRQALQTASAATKTSFIYGIHASNAQAIKMGETGVNGATHYQTLLN